MKREIKNKLKEEKGLSFLVVFQFLLVWGFGKRERGKKKKRGFEGVVGV